MLPIFILAAAAVLGSSSHLRAQPPGTPNVRNKLVATAGQRGKRADSDEEGVCSSSSDDVESPGADPRVPDESIVEQLLGDGPEAQIDKGEPQPGPGQKECIGCMEPFGADRRPPRANDSIFEHCSQGCGGHGMACEECYKKHGRCMNNCERASKERVSRQGPQANVDVEETLDWRIVETFLGNYRPPRDQLRRVLQWLGSGDCRVYRRAAELVQRLHPRGLLGASNATWRARTLANTTLAGIVPQREPGILHDGLGQGILRWVEWHNTQRQISYNLSRWYLNLHPSGELGAAWNHEIQGRYPDLTATQFLTLMDALTWMNYWRSLEVPWWPL